MWIRERPSTSALTRVDLDQAQMVMFSVICFSEVIVYMRLFTLTLIDCLPADILTRSRECIVKFLELAGFIQHC